MSESWLPTVAQLRQELTRQQRLGRQIRRAASVAGMLTVVAACAVLLATLVFPVLRISSSSMMPGLEAGDVVVALRHASIRRGDVIGFYYNDDVLVKRVVALGGEEVDILEDGTVTIDGQPLDEPYVVELDRGQCRTDLPLTVPYGQYFVMGDYRSTSLDSRSTIIGCVDSSQVFGRLILCAWPMEKIGIFRNDGKGAQQQ